MTAISLDRVLQLGVPVDKQINGKRYGYWDSFSRYSDALRSAAGTRERGYSARVIQFGNYLVWTVYVRGPRDA